MKRHQALQDLSRDHFHVLFRCQWIRHALTGKRPGAQFLPLVEQFLAFWKSDMSPHFEEEDRLVVPLAKKKESTQGVARRTLEEHQVLRQRIEALREIRTEADARNALAELEPAITAHVHMEEEELFEGVQGAFSEATLQELGLRSAAFRKEHREPGASGPRAGRG